MRLDLSAIIRQFSNNENVSNTEAAIKTVSNSVSGNLMLQEMLAGDTFTGKIMSIKDNMALLMLADGSSVSAHISDGVPIEIGQNITFLVEQNTKENISIKPLAINEQQAMMINKALDAAGFPSNAKNVNIVKELMGMNMPIDAATIEKMIAHTGEFPQANLRTIANLIRLQMPVTQNNIMQFEAYSNYQNNISGELNNIGEQLNQLFINLTHNNAAQQADNHANGMASLENQAALLNDIVNTLYQNSSEEMAASRTVDNFLTDSQMKNLEDTIQNLLKDAPDSDQLKFISNAIHDKSLTTNQLLSNLTTLLQNHPDFADRLGRLGEHSIMEKLFSEMVNETMKLTPDDVTKEDGIKNYYKRVRQALEKLTGEGREDALPQQLSKSMNEVKANIDFMNDLNRNMTYVQIPIQLKNSTTNGELYVFTNKKALAKGTDNVSAMLHLDMEHLGPIDIYVRLQNKNVSTHFCLASEELLDFVYAHIDKLDARLQALGYSTAFEMKVTAPAEQFDFVEDFVEKDMPKSMTSQFIFDIKA